MDREIERIDRTGFGDIVVIQKKGFGYGVDSVLLAAFAAGETGAAPVSTGSRIADLGTGCGIVAFALHHKLGRAKITGYDIRSGAIDCAGRACRMNGLEDDIDFVCADIGDVVSHMGIEAGSFDAVVTNPPYFRRTPDEPGAADPDERYIARHETTAGIDGFAAASASMLRAGGSLYMVHRPDRLADIFTAMRAAGIEPKDMQMVVPTVGKPANIVLIRGVKGAGSELKMLPEIAVHTPDGEYTDEILKIYER